jgi:cytochrome c oxidase assembly protein subunit 15
MTNKFFFRSALISTILSYLLIFVGGLVRVSGSGLGCPDWPKCFGRWIPPTSIEQIPAHIDPAIFNIVLAWIEYGNRMLGVIVGISIVVMTIIAIIYFRKNSKILYSSILSLFLVGANGGLGAIVVSSLLNPFVVSLHMILALFLVSVLSYTTIESYKLTNSNQFTGIHLSRSVSISLIALWILIIVEILLGTGIRTNIELIAIDNPLLSKGELLNALESYKYLHSVLGFSLLFLSAYLSYLFKDDFFGLSKQLVYFIFGMILFQIFLGELMIFFELPQLTRLFHTWGSSWLVGIIIILYNTLHYEQPK